MKKMTKVTYTTLATVALLGSITTATTVATNSHQVNATTIVSATATTKTAGAVTMNLLLPIIKDGKSTTILVKNVTGIPGGDMVEVPAPVIPGYTANDDVAMVAVSADGSSWEFLTEPLVYTKTAGAVTKDAFVSITKDGKFETIIIKNVTAVPGGDTVWVPAPEIEGYTPNIDRIELGLRADQSGFDVLTNIKYTKTSDTGSNNGNSSSNSGDNSSNSSSGSSQSSSSNSGTSNNNGSTNGTSQSGQGATNTNGGQQADKTTNGASKTANTNAKTKANQPTTLLQTGQDHPAMTVATVFSALVASVSGAFMFLKRF